MGTHAGKGEVPSRLFICNTKFSREISSCNDLDVGGTVLDEQVFKAAPTAVLGHTSPQKYN